MDDGHVTMDNGHWVTGQKTKDKEQWMLEAENFPFQ